MLNFLGIVIFLTILIEAITQIVTKSELFEPIRKFFFDRRKNKFFNWMHSLIDCGYCTSVWVGWFVVISFLFFKSMILNVFFIGIVLHRLSNILHFIIDRIDRNSDLNLE